jgi:glycerol-1-phosphate dehydrogenase [NAD(P)+]
MQTLLEAGAEERSYVSVGSGTLPILPASVPIATRYVYLPATAPSVGRFHLGRRRALVFLSVSNRRSLQGADGRIRRLPTLCAAPRSMIAAGFGDMLGKYTALADWNLGVLLMDEFYKYDEAVGSAATAR